MTTIFDGRAYAAEKEKLLVEKIAKLERPPKLVTILVGNDPASATYVDLKKKAGERVGIEVEIRVTLQSIESLNNDLAVDGIMIQLPIAEKEYINKINPQKDVDGMREDSPFLPATVKAILAIMEEAKVTKEMTIAVVGAKGEVGRRLFKVLEQSHKVIKLDKGDDFIQLLQADVIICATGIPGIITQNLVKESVILIDVGAPKPEVSPEAAQKASFVTPVPGGVGPVTIVSLLENVVEATSKK